MDAYRSICGASALDNVFEWLDFTHEAMGTMVECLDAAGIDGSVPHHACGGERADATSPD